MLMHPFGINYSLILEQELVGQINRCIQISAAIAFEVENKILHALRFEFQQCFEKLFIGVCCKAVQLYITRFVGQHIGGIEAVYRNLVANDTKIYQSLCSTANHFHIHRSAFFATEPFHDVGGGHIHAGNKRIVDIHNSVARQDADFLRRTARNGLYDIKRIFEHIELHPYPLKIPLERLIHFGHFLFGNIT